MQYNSIVHFTTSGNGFTETQVSCPQQGANQFLDLSKMARMPMAASLRSRDLCQPWALLMFSLPSAWEWASSSGQEGCRGASGEAGCGCQQDKPQAHANPPRSAGGLPVCLFHQNSLPIFSPMPHTPRPGSLASRE